MEAILTLAMVFIHVVMLRNTEAMEISSWVLYSRHYSNDQCLMRNERRFCHFTPMNILEQTCVHGNLWTFKAFKENTITSEDLLGWSIPFDLVESYAAYLEDSSSTSSLDDMSICNCTKHWIGHRCQYGMSGGSTTFFSLLDSQMLENRSSNYETLTRFVDGIECEGGSTFLEWRHICDGITQCHNGADELDCDLLEFHSCDSDEYQCRNGMCIPLEFAFDGTPDCLDETDDQKLENFQKEKLSCRRKSNDYCDDTMCSREEFSCGDGTCVPWNAILGLSDGCYNNRHAAFMCETSTSLKVNLGKEWPGICKETTDIVMKITESSSCLQSISYLLQVNPNSRPNDIILSNIRKECEERIIYRKQNAFLSGFYYVYNRSRIEQFLDDPKNARRLFSRSPDSISFNGKIYCNNITVNITDTLWISRAQMEALGRLPFFSIPYMLCYRYLNHSFNHSHVSEKVYHCKNTTTSLSSRRINDGFIDCLYGDDERNIDYTDLKKFRFRCQTVGFPFQYVHYSLIGNRENDCIDGSDEISQHLNWSNFECFTVDRYECWVFQENRIDSVRLAFQRYCDTIWDTMNGQDERNCSTWLCEIGFLKCNFTGQCIKPSYICDGDFDCSDGEDELNCSKYPSLWILEHRCNRSTELFCITNDYRKDQKAFQPCIERKRVGDQIVDCIGGRDERNVLSCPDHRMIGDRFLCDNNTKCIEYSSICDGLVDCYDGTDESICYWNNGYCKAPMFSCADLNGCKSSRCRKDSACNDKSHFFWCPRAVDIGYDYRHTKIRSNIENKRNCYNDEQIKLKEKLVNLVSNSDNKTIMQPSNAKNYLCNRGVALRKAENSTMVCFCPLTFYGNHCEFSSRRVVFKILFKRYEHQDIPKVLTILAILLLDNTTIIDHHLFHDDHRTLEKKHRFHLYYSRPKLLGEYKVRIEAFHFTDFIYSWEYKISPFDFLPVFQISKVLQFPVYAVPQICLKNICLNNGTCYRAERDHFICICTRDWKGQLCEIPMGKVQCALRSLTRTENICLCPHGYVQPNCYVKYDACRRVQCRWNEQCISQSSFPIGRTICYCEERNCNPNRPFLTIEKRTSNHAPSLIQLLQLAGSYINIRQQILLDSKRQFPVVELIKTKDDRNRTGLTPEIGLLHTFHFNHTTIRILTYLLYINCSKSSRNLSVDIDLPYSLCQTLPRDFSNRVSLFPTLCQTRVFGDCFISDAYICYCENSQYNRSLCFSYQHRYEICNFCHNRGHCVRGDQKDNTDFLCICPKCVSGVLCQYSTDRYSISLELLFEKTGWQSFHFIGPIILLFIGTILTGCSILTFFDIEIRTSGIGIHLLATSISSLLVLIIFSMRITFLYFINRIRVDRSFNTFLCKSLPFSMYSAYYMSSWIMAMITVERACAALRLSLWHHIQKPLVSLVVLFSATIFVIFSNYPMIGQYRLVNHPDHVFPWCIREIELNQQAFARASSIINHLMPFVINTSAALIIIIVISRSKASVQQKTTFHSIKNQLKEHFDLLLAPLTCLFTQLPEITILFIDACDFQDLKWFSAMTLIFYYISFVPHISIFFFYIMPSKKYQQIFLIRTWLGRYCKKITTTTQNTYTHSQ